MTTIIERETSGYSIPAKNYDHDDEFHVAVRTLDHKTRNYRTKNTGGWKDRIRRFVQRVSDESEYAIRQVTVSHVEGGERLSRRTWTEKELSTIE